MIIIFFPADKVHIASRHGLVSISAHAVTQPETEGDGGEKGGSWFESISQAVCQTCVKTLRENTDK